MKQGGRKPAVASSGESWLLCINETLLFHVWFDFNRIYSTMHSITFNQTLRSIPWNAYLLHRTSEYQHTRFCMKLLSWQTYWCCFYQSRRSPKVVALFLLQTLVAIQHQCWTCMIQSKWIQFLLPNLVAFISHNQKTFGFSTIIC